MARQFDPAGKRALFQTPVQAPKDAIIPGSATEGKGALFSAGRRRPGTVLVECESCTARSRVALADLGIRMLSGSFWLPTRSHHPHWMRCPACQHHSWCRIGWQE